MSLIGQGVVAIWNDIPPEALPDFYEWHNREHMAERVAIPGFRRGRRYLAVEAQPEFFMLYETDDRTVLSGQDYLARLNNPTPWTRRCIKYFINTSRSLCSVARSIGSGEGGLVMTYRFDADPSREAELRALIEAELPRLEAAPGVCGAHLCLADRAASAVQTVEKRANPETARVWTWVVLVEGSGDAASVRAACDTMLPAARLTAAGALAPIEVGLYRLQYAT
jgi:hypothetical protein